MFDLTSFAPCFFVLTLWNRGSKVRVSLEQAVVIPWAAVKGLCRRHHSLSLCASAAFPYTSGSWRLPLALAPALPDRFESHVFLHFSTYLIYFVKLTERIHLLKC